MSHTPSTSRKPATSNLWFKVSLLAFAAVTLVLFPPFRIVPPHTANVPGDTFSASSFAEKFWAEKLAPAAARAPDAATLVPLLRSNPKEAAKSHALQVGLGTNGYYFRHITGRITSVERGRILISNGDAVFAVHSGPVFGNSLRDGCGLLDVNQVPGLSEFNALSAEFNRLAEERVQPLLNKAVAGNSLSVAGIAAAPESVAGGKEPLLTFIPISVEVMP